MTNEISAQAAAKITILAFVGGLLGCDELEEFLGGADAGADASLADAQVMADAGAATDAGLDTGVEPDPGVDGGVETDAGSDAGTILDSGTDAGTMGPPWCETWNVCGNQQILFSEDFESGFGQWSVEGGLWDVGAPTAASGPSAHGGSGVAGTVLDGTYPTANPTNGAWLISPELTIPVARDNPTLRVWIWSYMRVSHYAAIHIREVGGNWRLIDSFGGDNAQWVQKRIHLGDWAERTVQVGFQLYNRVGDNQVPRAGFYIDDFSLETGPASMSEREGFEGGYGDWSVEGGVWAIGAPSAPEGPQAFSGTAVAGTVLDGVYPTVNPTNGVWLVSPELTVPVASENPTLRVRIWSFVRESHFAAIEIREVGGQWRSIDTVLGDNAHWAQRRVSLAQWAERTVQIGFRLYHRVGDNEVPRAGFYVDDFSLETGPAELADPEGFENGYGDWTIEGGIWAIGQPTAADGPEPYAGSSVAGTVLDGPYPTANPSNGVWLISPELEVPNATLNPRLQVFVWSWVREAHFVAIQVRELGGSWTDLDSWGGEDSQWVPKRLSLSPWAERTVQIGFRLYNRVGGNQVPRPGFYIDQFSIITD